MPDLLTPLHTRTRTEADRTEHQLVPVETQKSEKSVFAINRPEDALEALRSKPDYATLGRTLRWLNRTVQRVDDFNIKKPGPKAAQIIFTLINDIVPDYWETLSAEGSKKTSPLIQCLSSVAGIGAIISRLRLLLGQLRDAQKPAQVTSASKTHPVEILLSVLETVLAKEDFLTALWHDIESYNLPPSQKSLQWKEFVSLVASGKVLSIASEVNLTLSELSPSIKAGSWVGDGSQYAAWLGRCMQQTVITVKDDDVEGGKALSQLLSKGLTLGYTDQLVRAGFLDLLSGDNRSLQKYKALMAKLSAHEQKTLLYSIIRISSQHHLPMEGPSRDSGREGQGKAIGGVAALIRAIVGNVPTLQDDLVEWLVGVSADAVGQVHNAHRAVIAALSSIPKQVTKALQKGLTLFGDKLYIKHTPTLHQEVNAQVLLMLAGYTLRADKTYLMHLCPSSIYLNAISNRLAASSQRARFLGMVVGTAFSELVDPKDKRMTFSADEINGSDGRWYRSLTSVNDSVGSIKDLKPASTPSTKSSTQLAKPVNSSESARPKNSAQLTSKVISIEEIDSSESEVEDLPMYEKPDSDPDDEDEDPTIVQRNRPTAPVYIRDLIAGLREDENFDRHNLALSTASNLIRRKAAFGTEVSDNIEELASILVGLGEKWPMENFQQMRLQGMIAVLIAEPLKMGQWFSRTFYNGDYSMGQRASVLTVLGLGARELAGLGKEDAALTGANATTESSFPSKRLPDKLHNIYALEAAPMDAISSQLEKTMIQPMAAEAADKFSGPNALKVRTFSSRMAVEKKRQKPIPNALAKVVADGFFFPLTGRWRIHLQSYGENSSHTSPFLLSHLLKTLSLILHASGTSTLSLPQMTCEFWDLLLSLRSRAADPSVLEALLFAFLTLLDINENDQRRLAEQHARELLETQEWVDSVFEKIGGGSEEGERIRMLAAGVLMRCREIVEKYQRMLMGDLVDFM